MCVRLGAALLALACQDAAAASDEENATFADLDRRAEAVLGLGPDDFWGFVYRLAHPDEEQPSLGSRLGLDLATYAAVTQNLEGVASMVQQLPGRLLGTGVEQPPPEPVFETGVQEPPSPGSPRLRAMSVDDLRRAWPPNAGGDIDALLCPITQEVMTDPVVAADGVTYERAAIVAQMARARLSPTTSQLLPHGELMPNYAIRDLLGAMASRLEALATRNPAGGGGDAGLRPRG